MLQPRLAEQVFSCPVAVKPLLFYAAQTLIRAGPIFFLSRFSQHPYDQFGNSSRSNGTE
jgi:hypothetical protein